jgi:hypothetical protein
MGQREFAEEGRGTTPEDVSRMEFEQAVVEAAEIHKGDVEAVVQKLISYTEAEIKEKESERWYFDEAFTGEKPEMQPDGRIKIGPKYFKWSKSKQIRLLREALTSARKESRLLLSTVLKEEKAKYKAKMAEFKGRQAVNAVIKKIREFPESKAYQQMLPHLKAKVDAVLANFDLHGFKPGYRGALDEIKKWMKDPERKELLDIDDETLDEVARLDQKNLRDMTADELDQLYAVLMEYAMLSDEVQHMLVEEQKQDFLEAREEAIGDMREPEAQISEEISSAADHMKMVKDKAKQIWNTWLGIGQEHYDYTVERMSGVGKILSKVAVKAISGGRAKANDYEQTMSDYLKERVEAAGLQINELAKYTDETVKTGPLTLTRGERVALALHAQNEDNWACFQEAGFGLKFKDPDKVYYAGKDYTAEDLDAVIASLTDQEKELVEILRDMDDQMGEDINGLYQQIHGRQLKMVENHWYKDTMPIGRGLTDEEKGVKEMAERMTARPGVPKGRTKERKGVTLPLYLNNAFYDLWKSVEFASAYIGFEVPLRQVSRLWQDRDFKTAVIERYGKRTWTETWKGLKDVAGEQFSYDEFERGLLRMRRGLMTVYIGLNPFTPLKQPLQWANALAYVDWGSLWRGTVRALGNMKEAKRLNMLMSSHFRDRVEMGFTRDIAEFNRVKGSRAFMRARQNWRQLATWAVRWMDANTVSAVMQGAVEQVLTQFKSGELDPYIAKALGIEGVKVENLSVGDKMKYAYQWADWVVSRTQDMSQPEHRSPLSRGGTFARMMTMFGSSTNQNWNLMRRLVTEARLTKDPAAYKRLAWALLAVIVLQPLAEAGIDELKDRLRKKEPKKLGFLARVISSLAGNLFFVRDIVDAVANQMQGGQYMDIDVAPTRVLNLMGKTIASGAQAIFGTTWKQRRRGLRTFISQGIDLLSIFFEVPIYWAKHQIEALLKEAKVWPYRF